MTSETSFTRKNKGIFHLSANFLQDDQLSTTLKIFQALQFIPTKVEFLWHANRLECSGLSPMFSSVSDHMVTPIYDVVVNINHDDKSDEDVFNVEVKESSIKNV